MKHQLFLILYLLFSPFSSFSSFAQSPDIDIPINAYGAVVVEDVSTYKKIVAANEDNIILDMRELVPDAQFEVKYASDNNIANRPLYKSADLFMRKPAALALKKAHELLKEQGYGLRFTDGYRPYDISVYFFVTVMDTTFVPHPKYGSRHNRGMAIDLTLFHLGNGQAVEMPSAIDETTERSYHSYMDASPNALKHRKLLKETLEKVGFESYPYEWWHYDYKGWESCKMFNLWHEEIREANTEIEATTSNLQDHIIASSFDFYSDILKEDRRLFISLPEGYEQSNTSYPVLYVLDANWRHEMVAGTVKYLSGNGDIIPEMIVVGIGFKDRLKDFLFEETAHLSQDMFDEKGGSAAQFLEFLMKEVLPFVEKNYRTNAFKLLHGHSMGGYFTSNIFLNNPELFNGYFAISPSFQMNDFQWLDRLEEKLAIANNEKTFFQLSLGNEGDPPYFKAWDRFTAAIDQTQKQHINWSHKRDTTNNHGSIPLLATYEGLRNIFSDYNFELIKGSAYQSATFEEAQEHYQKLSNLYGYTVHIPVGIILNRLQTMMQQGKVAEAITLLDEQIAIRPNKAFLYLLKAAGIAQLKGAEAAYEWVQKALSVANPDEVTVIDQVVKAQINNTKK